MDTTHQPVDEFEAQLINAHLKEAEECLLNTDLAGAQRCFREAMDYQGQYPERQKRIHALLKQYCDRAMTQEPADWTSAHAALDLIDTLGLTTEKTQTWQSDLWHKRAVLHLEKEEFDQSFKAFAEVAKDGRSAGEQAGLRAEIASALRSKISYQAKQGEWLALKNMIETFQATWSAEDELKQWVVTIADLLRLTQTEVKRQDEQTHALTAELQRSQALSKIVTAIFAVAAVVYVGILLIAR